LSWEGNLVELCGLFQLLVPTTLILEAWIRKSPALISCREKIVQHDAAPLCPVNGQEQRHARRQVITTQRAVDLVEDCRQPLVRYRHSRLAEKIADRFRGIVPAGVFKIEEAEAAVLRTDRVVKSEIRRRDAALAL